MQGGVVEEDVKYLFKLLDSDDDGILDASDVVQMFKKCGQLLNEHETKDVVTKLDINGDGRIDIEDFTYFCLKMSTGGIQN